MTRHRRTTTARPIAALLLLLLARACGALAAKSPTPPPQRAAAPQPPQPRSTAAFSSEGALGTDWIALLSEPTAIISEPRAGEVYEATSPAGAALVLDASSSQPERGGTISDFEWIITPAAGSGGEADVDAAIDGSTAVVRAPARASGRRSQLVLLPGLYTATLTVTSVQQSGGRSTSSDTVGTFTVAPQPEQPQTNVELPGAEPPDVLPPEAPLPLPAVGRPARGNEGTESDGGGDLDAAPPVVDLPQLWPGQQPTTSEPPPLQQEPEPPLTRYPGLGGAAPEQVLAPPPELLVPAPLPVTGLPELQPAAPPPALAPWPPLPAAPTLAPLPPAGAPAEPTPPVLPQLPEPAAPLLSPPLTPQQPWLPPAPPPALPTPAAEPSLAQPPVPGSEPVPTSPAGPVQTPPPVLPPLTLPAPTAAPAGVPAVPPPPPPPLLPPPYPAQPPQPPAPLPTVDPAQQPIVDESYCNADRDYDLANQLDWDDLKACCDEAREEGVLDADCSSLPPRPATPALVAPTPAVPPAAPPPAPPPTPPPSLPPTPPPAPAAPKPDESYCDPDQDYDLSLSADWDDLSVCCEAAKLSRVSDSQCAVLPPRPPPPPPPPPRVPVLDDDYCLLSDYDFNKPQDRLYFNTCCEDAKTEGVRDPDCERPQW